MLRAVRFRLLALCLLLAFADSVAIVAGQFAHRVSNRDSAPVRMDVNNRNAPAAAVAIPTILVGVNREVCCSLVVEGTKALVSVRGTVALDFPAEGLAIRQKRVVDDDLISVHRIDGGRAGSGSSSQPPRLSQVAGFGMKRPPHCCRHGSGAGASFSVAGNLQPLRADATPGCDLAAKP